MPKILELTVEDVFLAGCALASQNEEDAEPIMEFAVQWVNLLLAEALEYENNRRRFDADPARPPLEVAPVLEDVKDVVPYDDALCQVALPNGIASLVYLGDDEDYRSQDYRGRFVGALQEAVRATEESVRDVYA